MKKKISIMVAATLAVLSLSACATTKQEKIELEANYVASAKEAPVDASPEQAAAAVLKQVEETEGTSGAKVVTSSDFEKITGITSEEYLEVVAFESEAKDGLSNIFIVRPYPSLREDVRTKLLSYRESKIREFENFDILDSYTIAKNAVVYDQGDYLVMLMLKDPAQAQVQVDMYIPQ